MGKKGHLEYKVLTACPEAENQRAKKKKNPCQFSYHNHNIKKMLLLPDKLIHKESTETISHCLVKMLFSYDFVP